MMTLIIGAAVAAALLVAGGALWIQRAHQHQPAAASAPPPPAPQPAAPPRVEVDAAMAAQLRQELEAGYRQQIQTATAAFAGDLAQTSQKLSQQVERLTTEVISTELEQYQKTLEQVRGVASAAAQQLQAAVAQQQADLQKGLEEAVAAERDRRIASLDARLGEIVSSYLVESLGSGVDLGSQAGYIMQALEQRKEDIKRDLAGGV